MDGGRGMGELWAHEHELWSTEAIALILPGILLWAIAQNLIGLQA